MLKRLLLAWIILLCAVKPFVGTPLFYSTPVLIASTSAVSTIGEGKTSPNIDCTGANAAFFIDSYYSGDSSTLSDTGGNTWTTAESNTSVTSQGTTRIAIGQGGTFGAAQNFTSSAAVGNYVSFKIFCFSHVKTSGALDKHVSANSVGGVATLSAGSTGTLSASGELSIVGWGDGAGSSGLTVDSPYDIPAGSGTTYYGVASHYGSSAAWAVISGTTAQNPAWAWTTNGYGPAVNITVLSDTVAGSSCVGALMLLGAGGC